MKKLTPNAQEVMMNRYALRDDQGHPKETVKDILARTARVVAQAEHNYRDGSTPQEIEKIFFELLSDFRFMPNGRTLANAGTGWGQLANCFVLPIKDDMGRVSDGIFNTLRDAVLVLQSGGGVGFSFGRIRPKGDSIGSSKGKATGVVSFLKVYDTAFWVIGQGGGRRSACMAVLPVHHPDIRDFIHCKEREGVIEHFNISVGITDAFMEAVEKDTDFPLINPRNGEVWERVKARELFHEIVHFAHNNGEPGVLYLDAANRENPTPSQGDLEATNPCFVGSTRVATEYGLLRMDDLANLPLKELNIPADSRVTNKTDGISIVRSSNVFCTGKNKEVFEIVTSKGYRVTATANHEFYTHSGFKELHTLTIGDTVCLQSGEGMWSQEYVLPNYSLYEHSYSSQTMGAGGFILSQSYEKKLLNAPTMWSRELGVVMGWLVGDGWITRKSTTSIGFTFGKDEEGVEGLEHISAYMSRWFSRGCLSKRTRALQLTFGKSVAEFFTTLGILDVKSAFKRVPESIFSAPKEAVIGFLQGLFSADGSVQISEEKKSCSIRLASSSQLLLQDVQKILINFGIISSIYLRRKSGETYLPDSKGNAKIYKTSTQYELIIDANGRNIFAEHIGFVLSTKQHKLNLHIAHMKKGSYRQHFEDCIISITPMGKQNVYDLTEPIQHSFIADGFVVHNCGEQYLMPYENCCMASINLAEHVIEDTKKKGLFPYRIDWQKLAETVQYTVRWLDDVVDTNKYVSAVPALEEAAKRNRRIGVSIMGLADMLYAIGVRYGSREGIDCAGHVMEFIRFHTLTASNALAKERGAFPGIKGSRYDYSDANLAFLKSKNMKPFAQPKPLHEYKHTFGMPKLDWSSLEKEIRVSGVRNSCQNTIQPTGAIATISGLEGYGCEPVFALSYVMRTHEGAEKLGQEFRELYYESRLFREALERAGVDKKKRDIMFEEIRQHGTCQNVEGVPKEVRDVFVVSGDVSVDEHVEMEAALQRFVDNAISKTINFPAEATEDEVWKAYIRGWKLGLKGMTVYVTGSRSKVVLETGETQKKREEEGRTFNNEAFVGSPLVKVKPGDELCPECNTKLVIQEGCFVCPSCAYSKCSM